MRRLLGFMMTLLCWSPLLVTAQQYKLGLAAGYPPYQFIEGGRPSGLDIEIASVLAKSGLNLRIIQGNWDDIVARLRNKIGIDLVGGMEISEERKARFDFSLALYKRKNVVFVRTENTSIKKLADLAGKIVSGDRGSYVESRLDKTGIKSAVRLIEYESKEESMQALKDGKTVAAIMPDAVGFYLARKLGLAVKSIDVGDPGTPVAFAVRKGDNATLAAINAAIQEAIRRKSIAPIIAKWLN